MLSSGDGLFLGQSEKFTTAIITLSTIGAGGQVSWYYWDGYDWIAFTPASGIYSFDSSPATVRLFDDESQIPSDWQKCIVGNAAGYWVKVIVNSDFSTGPVGSQITGVQNISYIIAE